ncbi:MAG TPA: zf-HC2 domain-containing protein [Thermoanaerobaculia bacterium]|nr:zf-HC2 domain-containing protein [Thermoanaerobaculia bacterium]
MSAPDRYTCDEVFRRLDLYLDRTLSPEELRLVQEHLETCAACAGEYRFEENVIAEVRRKVARIEAPAGLMERIAARLAGGGDEPET